MPPLSWIALAIFICVYAAITTEVAHKAIISLFGGALFVVLGILDAGEAYSFIDWNVIFLLISMMVIVSITRHTGVFQYLAIKAAKISRGDPMRILLLLSLITALLSAFLDNVTTIMIISPVTILIAVELGVSPVPFLISVAIASNIGGTATLIGDPPNIMIGSAAGLTFMDFLVNLTPAIILVMAGFSLMAFLLFRKSLRVSAERKARIMTFNEREALQDTPRLVKSLGVLGLVIVGFLLHGLIHVEASAVALFGATLLMLLTDRHEVDEVFREVEWGTIFFFVGLFILVGGLVKLGFVGLVAQKLLDLTRGNLRTTSLIVIWASGVFSAFVDNIPYVATMTPLIKHIGESLGAQAILPLWWSLSLGACLGGNGTLIGASANVLAVGLARKSGYKISFMDFTRYGVMFTLMSLIVSTGYVLLRYFLRG